MLTRPHARQRTCDRRGQAHSEKRRGSAEAWNASRGIFRSNMRLDLLGDVGPARVRYLSGHLHTVEGRRLAAKGGS
jgi:hypothetical protein